MDVKPNPLASDPRVLAASPFSEAARHLALADARERETRAADNAPGGAPAGGAASPPLPVAHPMDTLAQSQEIQAKMRLAHEASFGRLARWIRRVSGFPKSLYEFADSVDERVRGIFRDQQAQDLAIQDLTRLANQLATESNREREAYALLARRLAYYEQQVPAVRRARETFDRDEAIRLAREAEAALAMRPPVIPFTREGVRADAATSNHESQRPYLEFEDTDAGPEEPEWGDTGEHEIDPDDT